ncbi:MAG: hypothetical protein ACI89U_001649 [Gammaproteobacteria bacterium]|jgi:hypothetical protein
MSFLRSFLLALFIGSIFVISVNTAVDPLRFFSDQSIAEYEKQTRYRFPGLIRNKSFDTVFVGTSMAQNFIKEDIDQLFDVNSLLLAIAGGSLREQSLMVELALATKKPKRIIWEVYEGALINGVNEVRKGAGFPFYMYDDDRFNDIFYLFNFSNTVKSVEAIGDYLIGNTIDENYWKTMDFHSGKFPHGCPELMQSQLRDGGLLSETKDMHIPPADIVSNIDRNLLDIIRDNPEIEFVLFAPPVSYAFQAMLKNTQPDKFAAITLAKTYLYPKLMELPNVKMQEYFSEQTMVKNLENYRDLMHFSAGLSHELLVSIHNEERKMSVDWHKQLLKHNEELSRYPFEQVLDNCLSNRQVGD